MKPREPFIVFKDVSYRYPRSKVMALKHLNLTIYRGEFIAILGENGAGKSTFCQTLNGIIPHSRGGWMQGEVRVGGLVTHETPVAELAQQVDMVLEDPETQLFTTSVLNEVAFGPENLGVEPGEILRRARWALEVVRLSGYEDRPPAALSGGQKQRLAIAAALAMSPTVLVLDEATSQLDPVGTVEILSIVQTLNQQYGMTIVMATSKSEEVVEFCDRMLVLDKGELIAQGKPREIYADRDLLRRVMLCIPQVSALAAYLAEDGVSLEEFPVTLDEARRGITRVMGL